MYAYYIVKAYASSIKTRSVYDYPYNAFFTSHLCVVCKKHANISSIMNLFHG